MRRSRENRRRQRSSLTPNWLLVGLIIAFLVAAGTTAFLTFVSVRDIVASWRSPDLPEVALEQPQSENPVPSKDLGPEGNTPLQPDSGPPSQSWDGESRVSLLVMGLDYRDWENGEGAPRTDTMILLSLDPPSRTAGMLSIPRDLWVNIPGYEPAKINQAYRDGELFDADGGGPGLAMQTVEELLGMEIDYYAVVDFYAFEQFIDELGGVKVDVPEEIVVDPLGDNNTKTLQPGVQTLPGYLALAYARARNTIGSDFDRAARQQQVIMGIRDRILSKEMLTTLIERAPALYKTLSAGVRTNLTLLQVVRLAWLAPQIPQESIKQGIIGPDQVAFATSFDGQEILQPLPEEIRLLRDEIFTTSGPVSPASTETDPQELIAAENAYISILNGTLNPGLASETTAYLKSSGITQVESGNAEALYSQTTLIDYTGNPHTVQYLVDLLAISPDNVYHRYDVSSQADIVVLLGEDWASSNAMP